MNRGQAIRLGLILGLTLTLLMVVGGWFYLSHARRSAMAQAQALLESPDANVRLQAAETVLRYWPSDEPALLAQARSLNDLGRYSISRRGLNGLTKHPQTPVRLAAYQQMADSYLGQAYEAMADAVATNYDLIATQVEPLLVETDGIVKALAVEPTAQVDRAVIEARQFDARMELASIRLKSVDLQWNKIRAVQETQEVHAVAAQAGQWQSQYKDIQKQLESHLERSLVRYPDDARLRYQMFRLRLHQGHWGQARKTVQEIARLPKVPSPIALAVADELLNMQEWHDQPVEPSDVALAAKLLVLDSPAGVGLAGLAHVELALAQKRFDEALTRIHAILTIAEGHPRAMCLKAQALIGLGRADEAVRLLVPLNDRVRQALVRQTLGQAYVAAGQVRQGRELWRQAIDMNPQRLSARLLLAQSLADEGMVLSGESDILQAYRYQPDHPRVLSLYVRLLAEKNDAVKWIPLLDQRTQPLAWDDAALAAAMTLDDVEFVAAWAEKRLAVDAVDPLACLAQVWSRMPALKRPAMAMIVNQWALAQMESEPMDQVQAAPILAARYRVIPPVDQDAAQGRLVNPQVLEQGYFLSWPIQSTIRLLDLAIARWPQPEELPRQKQKLQAMFHPSTVTESKEWGDLLSLMKDQPEGYWLKVKKIVFDRWRKYPWDESAALEVIRRGLAQGDWSRSQEVVQWAKQANRPLGMLLSARLNLAMGRHLDALHDAELLAQETTDTEWRWLVGEVRGHVYLINGQPDVAEGGFENLAISMPHHVWIMRIAAVDVLLAAGRYPSAAAQISTLLADPRLPKRETDMLLARSRLAMSPTRQIKMIEGLARYKPDDSLLMLYKAQAMAESGDAVGAALLVDQLQRKHPTSLRVWRLAGQAALAAGRMDQAMQAYQKLLQAAGEAEKVARDDLERIGSAASPSAQGAVKP